MQGKHTALVAETGGPRARLADPVSSHVAADRSSKTRRPVAAAVLWLIDQYGPMNGAALCDRYMSMRRVQQWPVAAYESPRKRAGELVESGELVVLNEDDPRGTPHIYALPRIGVAA